MPVALAGHSLGEYGALVAAGSLDTLDALELVTLRGRLMQAIEDRGQAGGMVAVAGRDLAVVPALVREFDLVIANDNAPHQVVLSGTERKLEEMLTALSAARVRAVRLPVKCACHSPLMRDVVHTLRKALAKVQVRRPRLLTVCSTTAAPFTDIRDELAAGVVRSVRWRESLEWLHDRGCARFLEIGPGSVLTRLATATYGAAVEATTVDQLVRVCD